MSFQAGIIQEYETLIRNFNSEQFNFISSKKNFAVFVCSINYAVICDESSQLMADHLSPNCQVLQYLYLVHGVLDGIHLPLALFLLLDRNKDTYTDIWKYLRQACQREGLTFKPSKFRLDPEQTAARTAFAEAFPRCIVYVSGRQLSRCWFSRLMPYMTDELKRHYDRDDTVMARWLRGVFGLPYLPADRVIEGYNLLVTRRPNVSDPVMPFYVHLHDTYVRPGAPYPATDWATGPESAREPDADGVLFAPIFRKFVAEQGRTAETLLECAVSLQRLTNNGIRMVERSYPFPFRFPDNEHLRRRSLATQSWSLQNAGRISLLDYVQFMGTKTAPRG